MHGTSMPLTISSTPSSRIHEVVWALFYSFLRVLVDALLLWKFRRPVLYQLFSFEL